MLRNTANRTIVSKIFEYSLIQFIIDYNVQNFDFIEVDPREKANGTSAASETDGENKMKITDLPPYCLDQILSNLDRSDLVNAAKANNIMTSSANRVTTNRYYFYGL